MRFWSRTSRGILYTPLRCAAALGAYRREGVEAFVSAPEPARAVSRVC